METEKQPEVTERTSESKKEIVMKKHCTYFSEMEYSEEDNSSEVLARGCYKNLDFLVLNIAHNHPCGYVDVRNTKLNGLHYDDVAVSCHGGLTYSNAFTPLTCEKGWWIGWDYAHLRDYDPRFTAYMRRECRKYTTEDVVSECIEVINKVWELCEKGLVDESK